MKATLFAVGMALAAALCAASCFMPVERDQAFTGAENEIRLITLDPGHFHAALVQKVMYDQVSPLVHVYAPDSSDVDDHLRRIEGFNARQEKPTFWEERVYRGEDYLEKMIAQKRGNVVVLSGNNARKPHYIKACVEAGLHVLADKPMCIDATGREILEEAFEIAADKGVLIYDVMTERSEITTILQKELAQVPELFGTLVRGTPENPAVVKKSVHHLFKYVAGNPIKRPGWFFDPAQQGESTVDVATHLVDLVQWECFPDEIIDFERDVKILSCRRWPTELTGAQFGKPTRLDDFPPFLKKRMQNEKKYKYYCNGEMIYTIKGVHALVHAAWDFEAPEGGGDTHYSILRGSRAELVIEQGAAQGYKPELYARPAPGADRDAFANAFAAAISALAKKYEGIGLACDGDVWRVIIPAALRIGHEAHFAQVVDRFRQYLVGGRLPAWEEPNMIAKYRTTTGALGMAKHQDFMDAGLAATRDEAVILFDGSGFDAWKADKGGKPQWTIEGGAMKVKTGSGSILTRESFGDFRLHLEFTIPQMPPLEPGANRGNRGNSGVYLQRRYEVQILDSFGVDLEKWDCGALYRARAPDRNVSKKPGEWQSFDIVFRAARWEASGKEAKKRENARISVLHNGVMIHDNVDLENKTGQGNPEGPEPAPILLQDHGNELKFRNIWIVPLDGTSSRLQPIKER